MGTLYDELGVRPDATASELRQAYRRRAREVHPDLRQGDATEAEAAMAKLNVAWMVLSDPDARRRYDLDLSLAGSQARAQRLAEERPWEQPAAGSFHGGIGDDTAPRPRMRPAFWLLLVGVLTVIFVFTAYAADRPGGSPAQGGRPGQCLSAIPKLDTYVPCDQPNVGKLVTEVTPDQPCPPGTFRHLLESRNQVACLKRT